MTTILAITSDWHVNDTTALSPPIFRREESSGHHASELQLSIWSSWKEYWALVEAYKKRFKAVVLGLALGDLGDLNRYSKSQLISPLETDVHNALLDVLVPTEDIVDHWIIMRGTEAHTGASGKLEEWLASDLTNALPSPSNTKSWWVWKALIAGVRIHAAHTLPSGTRLAGRRGSAVSNSCIYIADEYDLASEPKPHLCFWGHRHWYAPGWNRNIHGYSTPSWKGLGSYAHHIGVTIPSHIGGLICILPGQGGEKWTVKPFLRKLPTPAIWTLDSLPTSTSKRRRFWKRSKS